MKKIYIHTDLEGVSGIDKAEMIPKESPDFAYCSERLLTDINAAIEGAFAGGATHVTVMDAHAGGGNCDLSKLDKRAEIDTKPNGEWWGILDDSYWGSFFIGAHAMAGTLNGFLDHTRNSSTIFNYYINDRAMGELGNWGFVCGHFGVPVIMVSGDLAAINEAVQFFGDIETATVKTGISRQRAQLIPNDEAYERIRSAAERAVSRAERKQPFLPLLPMEVKIEFMRADYCDYNANNRPGVERLNARTARRIANSYLDYWLYKI